MSPGEVLLGTRSSDGCLAPHHPVWYELHAPWQTSWCMLMVVSFFRQISSFSFLFAHHQVAPEHLALWEAGWWMLVEVSFLRWISILSSPYITRLHPCISLFGRPPGGLPSGGCSWRCLSLVKSPFSLFVRPPGDDLLVDVRGMSFLK